jgi:hypothetical protein
MPGPDDHTETIAHQLSSFLWRTSVMLVLLTGSYYLLPVHGPFDDSAAAARSGAVLLALGGVVAVVRMQLRARSLRPSVWTLAESLLTALYLLVLIFATVYDRIAVSAPSQISGISSRTDALYFSVTIVSTVGFGDIHAAGSAARSLVTVQMIIDLVYVGTALRVLSNLRGAGSEP